MVRSLRACVLACIMVIAIAIPLQASTPYQGTISDSYKYIFEDVVSDLSIFDNYVFWRSGEYQYSLLSGDLTLENGVFSVTGGDLYVVDIVLFDSGSWNNGSYHVYTHTSGIDYTFDSLGYLVYSDLDGYPKLEGRGVNYAFICAFILCVFGFASLVWSIFSFCIRSRNE